jgi:hypothetical protein
MIQINNPELMLIIAGGRIKYRRCTAKSSYTKVQCKRPASKLSKTSKCSRHGGLSTDPKTKAGKDRIRETHLKHGEETKEARAERSAMSTKLLYLRDIGDHIGMFTGTHTRGRKPDGYYKLDLNTNLGLNLALLKTNE